MLHVLLGILKVIGILLAVLLGLALLVLLSVLFVPIRYEVSGSKREEIRIKGRVSWLLRIVTFRGGYEKGEPFVKLKLFGIPVADLLAEEEESQKEKKLKPKKEKKLKREKKPKEVRKVVEEPSGSEAAVEEETETAWEPVTESTPLKEPASEKVSFGKKTAGFWKKITNLKYTFRRFCDKIKEGREFVFDERTKAAFKLCKSELFRLLRKLMPRKLKGDIRFGFEDPAMTGEILGGISIFYPLFMDNVKISPNFEGECLEGELYLKGKLQVAILLPTLWRLWRDPNIRFLYRKFWG